MRLDEKCEMLVPYGVKKQLEQEGFGTQPTIRKALSGTYNANNRDERARALRVRHRAYMLGGCLVGAEHHEKEEE